MRVMLLNLFLSVAACSLLPATGAAVPIADLHQNDATGVPTMLGDTVTVTGVVTVPTGLLDDYHLEVYVQDATGGINVWINGGAGSYPVALGDSVTVTSRVAQYNGLTELGTSSSYTTIVNHGAATVIPLPLPISCAELENSFHGDYSEPNESALIRLDNLTIVSGTWPETPGGNTMIHVNDGTATTLLYIDEDTPVNGSDHPGDNFSAIGILKQYDASAPYTSGYELVPRYASDIIPPGGAQLLPGRVRNVAQTSADVLFETSQPGSSEVEYGPTDAYGSTAGDPGAMVVNHTVPLTGLTPDTIYHFRVKSTNNGGTDYGPDQLLATASDVPGEIHVMMSHGAEHEYAGGYDEVSQLQNLSVQLALKLNSAAVTSVDAAFYSLSMQNVTNSLILAHDRGCQVRLIIDQNNSTDHAEQCAAVGIPYIVSSFAGNHATGFMHNKYVVMNGRDGDPANDWVWTGSANMSFYGNSDVNNALLIRDHGLAQAYTLEFNEMWGSDTQIPGAGARMGSIKHDNTPHEFTINGLRVEQYMSPSDGVTGKIIEAITSADHSLYFAILAFTHNDVSLAMRDRRDAVIGLQVSGVFEQDQGTCWEGSEYFALHGETCAPNYWNPPADVWLDTALDPEDYLHHKYLIVDANWTDSDPLVLTGSHNWSYNAETVNDENTVIIHDANVANQYLQEFAARYHESGGSEDLGVATGVADDAIDDHPSGDRVQERLISTFSCYPNPFNPLSRIEFLTNGPARVSVRIFDARGALIRAVASDEPMGPGLHILGWNGTDAAGRVMPSGAYFAQLSATGHDGAQQQQSLRMMLVR